MKTIYVGNLEWSTTTEEFESIFTPYGIVIKAEIKKDFNTGKSRGFGFITMENADKAIQEVNGKDFKGRKLIINDARKREDVPNKEAKVAPYTPQRKEFAPRPKFVPENNPVYPPRKDYRYQEKPRYNETPRDPNRRPPLAKDYSKKFIKKEYSPITEEDIYFN